MPTYQYSCTACGEQLEVVQKFSDDPLTECPSCHGRLRKLFSSVGVVFKGSGFYKTDSRSSGVARSSSSTGASSSDSSTSDSSTSPSTSPAAASSSSESSGSGEPSTGSPKKDGNSKVA